MIEYGKYGEKRYRLDFIDQIFNVWFCFRDFLIQDLTQITTGFFRYSVPAIGSHWPGFFFGDRNPIEFLGSAPLYRVN